MRPKLRPSQIFSRPRQNRDRDVPKQSLETETSRPRLHACSQQHLTSWHAPPIWNLYTLLFGSVAHCSCEYHAAHSDLYPFTSNLVHELHMMWAALLSVVLSVYYFGVLELWVGRANMTKMSEDPAFPQEGIKQPIAAWGLLQNTLVLNFCAFEQKHAVNTVLYFVWCCIINFLTLVGNSVTAILKSAILCQCCACWSICSVLLQTTVCGWCVQLLLINC